MVPHDCSYCAGRLDVATWWKTPPKTHLPHSFPHADHIRQCQTCQASFTHVLALPHLWWADYCRDANGYFGCEDAAAEDGSVSGIRTWSRFLVKQVTTGPGGSTDYNWHKLNIFTIWHRTTRRTTVLVFDPAHPAVWPSAIVCATEESRFSADRPTPDYRRLHDLARHGIHPSETLELATNAVDAILVHHGRVTSLLASGADLQGAGASVGDRLLFYQDMLRSLGLRSASNRDRLQNEIGLAFNTVTQYDARISLIGRAAQADGAAMRTIAFVTLAFLPATFVSAIFSMSFDYDSSSASWLVSPDFWRYWAVAVPVTIYTVLLWLA
ncbi:hypothetical protein B0T24DRAFT_651094 [Lasiosphaeria ovina]|uniref:Uncharacterized protein n=1 Tax=Lasiosphaeria ovina TaxID=92902 RepID=A0AAE0K538_9PEZI|nr:hypothetical protein B0T24DRAFT_651094 [Lasiosphaeria ovina]